jgi:Flp pilus assembly protein TadD
LVVRRISAFGISAGLLGYLALDGGGYDLVVRQRFGLIVWGAIALGFVFGLLPRGLPNRALAVPLISAAGLLAWMLLSFHWTGSDERTTTELARLLDYLGLITLALSSLNRHTFRAAAGGLSAAAFGITGVALASRLDPGAFRDVVHLFGTDRLSYPLDYWNALGAWAAMTIAIGLAWSAHARSNIVRAAAVAGLPMAGLVVYLTYSRAGVVGVVVAVVAVLALGKNRWTLLIHSIAAGAGSAIVILVARGHPEITNASGAAGAWTVFAVLLLVAAGCAATAIVTRSLRVDRLRLPASVAQPAMVVSVVLIGLALVAAHAPLSKAWDEFRNQRNVPAASDPASRLTTAGGKRDLVWSSAFAAFKAHPLDGIGPGTFEFWWAADGRDAEFVRDAHSLYLEQLAELGLPGFVFLAGLLLGLLAAALLARRQMDTAEMAASIAMVAAFIVFLVSAGVDWLWEETAVGALALGSISVAAAASSSRLRRRERRGQILRPGGRTAIVLIALAAAVAQVPGLVSTQRIRASEDAVRAGDLESARARAQESIDAEPWAASPHAQLALVDQQEGRIGEAEREARAAQSKEPTNWRWPLVLASIEVQSGQPKKARGTFVRGRRLFPLSPLYSPFSDLAAKVFPPRLLPRLRSAATQRQR